MSRTPRRPPVSVIVPFRGDRADARALIDSLLEVECGPGDELVVADNSENGSALVEGLTEDGLTVVAATGERSSYHARNAGAKAATGEWLLFTDADCRPSRGILDAYFRPTPTARVAALAGAVEGDPGQEAFLARYARSRNFLDQDVGLHAQADAAATANLLVRRSVFEELGGFEEGIRSGGDVDLCRRLQKAGFEIERRAKAGVQHLHREDLTDLLGSVARYSAGARWLNERYPGTARAWPLMHGLALCARDITVDLWRRDFEDAGFRGIDALGMFAHVAGYRASNRV